MITCNPYALWFEQGNQNLNQIKAFIIQLSVFSNQFLIAQLNKMIHADTLETMLASKEIQANELGVSFKSPGKKTDVHDLGSTEGGIEAARFIFPPAILSGYIPSLKNWAWILLT